MIGLKTFAATVVAMAILAANAAADSVTAQLNRDRTSVGIPVQLQIVIDGTTNATLPRTLDVDGLEIGLTGRSTQVRVENMRMSTSAVFVYTIIPNREGTFTIPSIDVTIGGRIHRTQAFDLVVDAGARPQPPVPGAPTQPFAPPGFADPGADAADADPERRIAFAELVIPKSSAFVGEVVPVEFRCYFRSGYAFQLEQRPEFVAEGLTVQRWAEPQRGEQIIDGVPYHVFTFRSAITPVKSGAIEIPPATLNAIGRVPSRAPQGFDDLFDEFFGGGPMLGFGGQRREIQLASEPQSLEVKALPREGRPDGFAGAVGEFTIAANAKQNEVGPGEPLTLEIALSGRGNFDSISGVEFVDADGWRTYAPTTEFEPSDYIGFGGTKIFEYHLVAETDQSSTPAAEFSYFDPAREKYFTISTEPEAVVALAPQRPAAPAPTASAPVAEPPDPEPPSDVAAADPVDEITVLERMVVRRFEALAASPGFLAANGLLALAVLAYAAAMLVRRASKSEAGIRSAQAREARRLLAAVSEPSLNETDFFRRAEAYLDFEAARAGAFDVRDWARSLEPEKCAHVESLLDRAHEVRFGGGVATAVDAAERERVVAALKNVAP